MELTVPVSNSGQSIERKTAYKKLPIIIFAVTALMTVLVWFADFMTNGDHLGFNVHTYGLSWGNALLVLIVAALLVLLTNKLIFNDWLKTLLSCLPAIVLIGFFYLSDAYADASFLASLQSWLNGYAWLFLVTFVLLGVALIIAVSVIGLARKLAISIAACVVLTGLFAGLVFVLNLLWDNQTAQSLSQAAGSLTQDNTVANIDNLGFEVYQPSYVTPGFELVTAADPLGLGPGLSLADGGDPTQFVFDYRYVGDSSSPNSPDAGSYSVAEYAVPVNYAPPQHCGIDSEGDKTGACHLIGHATAGCDLYVVNPTYITAFLQEAFCKLGNTIINIEPDGSLTTNASQTSQAQYNELLKIYDSLQLDSKQQLINVSGAS